MVESKFCEFSIYANETIPLSALSLYSDYVSYFSKKLEKKIVSFWEWALVSTGFGMKNVLVYTQVLGTNLKLSLTTRLFSCDFFCPSCLYFLFTIWYLALRYVLFFLFKYLCKLLLKYLCPLVPNMGAQNNL